MKAHALLRIEPGGGLVNDEELGPSEQGLRDAEALLHAAREGAQAAVAHVEEVGALQQGVHFVAAPLAGGDALECSQVLEQLERRDPGVEAESRGRSPSTRRTSSLYVSTSSPSSHTLPASASCGVASVRMSVDLPAPFGPRRPNMPCPMRPDGPLLRGNALDTRHVAVYHEALDREHEEYGAKPHSKASFRLLRHPSMLFAVRPTSGLRRHAIISSGSVRAWNTGLRQSWY
jgi:hypothetical protein